MNRQLISRAIVALIMGLLLGLSFAHTSQLAVLRGRQAFLIAQEHRFDRFTSAPHAFTGHILTAVLATFLFLFFYELLVLGVGRILKAPTSTYSER
jgi:hypothetical protein